MISKSENPVEFIHEGRYNALSFDAIAGLLEPNQIMKIRPVLFKELPENLEDYPLQPLTRPFMNGSKLWLVAAEGCFEIYVLKGM